MRSSISATISSPYSTFTLCALTALVAAVYKRLVSQRSPLLAILVVALCGCFVKASAQNVQHTENKPDQSLKSAARIDPSTLGMSVEIPLAGYPGRGGAQMPLVVKYSSKVWRIDYWMAFMAGSGYKTRTHPVFAEHSTAGWTSSLEPPRLELPGNSQLYTSECCYPSTPQTGKPVDPLTYESIYPPYYIKRMYVHLPDGSSHELRKDDDPHFFNGQSAVDATGKYLAVDGSRLVFDFDTGTLLLPDGARYIFTGASPQDLKVSSYIDRNGNTLLYNQTSRQWTDALGRVISDVLPTETFVDGLMQVPPDTDGDYNYDYYVPGVGGTLLHYVFRWKKLQGPTQTAYDSALTTPTQALSYDAQTKCINASLIPPQVSPYLFASNSSGGEFVCAYYSARFNPTVLAEVELPNGTKYEFKYNVYGEIERINYPTGGFETFTYGGLLPLGDATPMYNQTNRGVIARNVKTSEGASDQIWTYQTIVGQNGMPYTVKTTAPDGSYTERVLHKNGHSDLIQFGFDTPLAGMAYDERSYAANNQMLRRKLTGWQTSVGGNWGAQRDARVTKEVELILDTGTNALATTTTYNHDADLNVIETKEYGFVSVNQTTAQTGAITSIPQGALQRTAEATCLVNDPNIAQSTRDAYRARNMVGLPVSSRVKDAAGSIVAQSQINYDEGSYPILNYGWATGWQDPNTNIRGNATTTRSWLNTTGAWLETHAQYDNFGNMRKAWDARGNLSQVDFSSNYQYAFPTSTTSAVPDPTNFYGTNTPLTSSTVYDFSTGLPTQTTDANGVVTALEYNDILSRPTRVIRAQGTTIQSQTSTVYDDTNRTVTVTSDRDAFGDNILKSQTLYDGLGRATETRTYESANGYIATLQEYDTMGRTKRSSNPFRPASESPQWTTPTYDALGRMLTVTTPDGATVVTSYSGTSGTVTDQAGKSRRSETDALGRLTSVWEDPAGLNYQTTYLYDVLGNLRKVTQGSQRRYFAYDSLSRLIRAKNPEQATNTNLNYTDPVTGNGGWSLAYTYDANGNLATRVDARNITTSYIYDPLNRVVQTNYANDPAATANLVHRYDHGILGRGHRFEVRDADTLRLTATTQRVSERDALGRAKWLRAFYRKDAATQILAETRYTYDLAGAVKTLTYPSGRTVTYASDGAGRTASVAGTLGDATSRTYTSGITYSSFGGITQEQFGTTTPLYHKRQYNVRGQVYDIRLSTQSAQQSPDNWNRGALVTHYSNYGGVWGATGVDNNGNALRTHHFVPADDAISSYAFTYDDYAYDSLNRLTSVTERIGMSGATAFTQAYTYDRFGNRTINQAGTTPSGIINRQAFTVATATNRLGVPSGQSGQMGYDTAGNLTNDTYSGAGTRVYDAEGRMVQAADNAGQVSTYVYDGDGRRVRRITGGVEWLEVYGAGGELVQEFSKSDFALRAEYGYRNGEMVVKADATQGGLQWSWMVSDHLGTPRIITDQSGSLAGVKRHDYVPFGEEVGANVGGRTTTQGYGGNDQVRQKFTGYERDGETGLDFAQARYYSSFQGRFTSPDEPFAGVDEENPQTWNLYAYTSNNPLAHVDPDGRRWYRKQGEAPIWVNPNEDGSYTSPGEGYEPFIPTKEHQYFSIYSNDGRSVTMFGENADGSPRVSGPLQTGRVDDATGEVLALVVPGALLAKSARAAAASYTAYRATRRAVEAAQGAKKTMKQLAAEMGYSPSKAVRDALQPGGSRDALSAAEREIAAKFYERAAAEVVGGTKEAATKALNLARAKYLREGGKPPGGFQNFQ